MKQISITVAAKPGALENVVGLLAGQKVDIRALSLGTCAKDPKAREVKLIVNDLAAASEVLRANTIDCREEEVLVVAVADHPGGLHGLLKALAAQGIDIEHIYGFTSKKEGKALNVLSFNDTAKAAAVLRQHGFTPIDDPSHSREGQHESTELAEYFGTSEHWMELEPRE